jgi:hypothetical protein
MKTRLIQLIAGITLCVLCISVWPTTAAVIWEDDFDDLDGWTFFGYEDDGTGNWSVLVEGIEGNFSAEGGMLNVLDDGVRIAKHNSPANVGTWSFDMYIPETDSGCIDVVFMSDGGRPGFDNPGGSGAVFSGNWVALEAYVDADYFIFWYAEEGDVSVFTNWRIEHYGWHHFEISRTSDGYFTLWLNGTQKSLPATNDVTSSVYLELWCWNATGWAVDNIVVEAETPPPPPPDIVPYVIVGGVAAVVIVLAVVILRRR